MTKDNLVQAVADRDEGQCDQLHAWKIRSDAAMPYQVWRPFGDDDTVEVANAYGDIRTGRAGDFWWGYEMEYGELGEGVILRARLVEAVKVKTAGMSDEFDATALQVAQTINASTFSSNEEFVEKCQHLIAAALRSVVKREREECWKIASARWQEAYAECLKAVTDDGKLIFDASQATASGIAASIRARGEPHDR